MKRLHFKYFSRTKDTQTKRPSGGQTFLWRTPVSPQYLERENLWKACIQNPLLWNISLGLLLSVTWIIRRVMPWAWFYIIIIIFFF